MKDLHIATMQAKGIEKKLAKVRKQVREALDEHLADYAKHQDIEQLSDDMQDTLSDGYEKAFKLGLQKKHISSKDQSFLKKVANKQFDFLDGLMKDIEQGTSKMPVGQRLDLYSNYVDSLFWYGSLKGKDKQVYWNLDVEAENCPDCIELASGSPYDPEDLPTVPRAGETDCKANCKCYLSHKPHGFFWS